MKERFFTFPTGDVPDTGAKKVDVFNAVFGVKADGNVNPRGDPHGELKGKNVLTRWVFGSCVKTQKQALMDFS